MKMIHIYILYFFLAQSVLSQDLAYWEILNQGLLPEHNYSNIERMDFINDQDGWLFGKKLVLKTINGGDDWYPITIPETIFANTIDFTSELNGWAIGLANVTNSDYGLFWTQDGGSSWILKKTFSGNNVHSFCAVSDQIIFVMEVVDNGDCLDEQGLREAAGRIYKTIDGGSSWQNVTPDSLYIPGFHYSRDPSIVFFNEFIGIAISRCGERLYIDRTIDGGQSWDRQRLFKFRYLYNIHAYSASTFYFLAKNENADTTYFCWTDDTFKTWSVKYATTDHISSFALNSDSDFFASFQDSTFYRLEKYRLEKSVDKGQTWEYKQTLEWGVDHIQFINTEVGLILGGGPTLWKSNDGGNSWKKKFFDYPFSNVFFIDKNHGFACGGSGGCFHAECESEGILFKTSDGGKNWYIDFYVYNAGRVEEGMYSEFKSIKFIDETRAFLLSGRSIYKTDDGGNSWVETFINNPDSLYFRFNDLFFLDEHIGWAVGRVINITRDGGESWEVQYPRPEDFNGKYFSLNSVCFANDTIGWAVGGSGLILKYTRQGQWQAQPFVTDLPLNKVYFIDQQRGWISGGYLNNQDFQSTIFKTVDGGETWKESRLEKYIVNDFYFTDSLHGWVVGEDTAYTGLILETFDGGENWIPVIENLSASLQAIHFKGEVGWAVGDNGLILKMDGFI